MRPRIASRVTFEDMDAAPTPTVSAERAFLCDVRLVLAALNQARYPLMRRAFGVSREQVNLLTFVVALSVAGATYDVIARFLRHPWPLDGAETAMAAAVVREAGFGIAGPKIRQTHVFGALIAIVAMKGLALPGLRRALHSAHVVEQRIGRQRESIYGAAVEQLKFQRPTAPSSAA
jgi:hypothetical protein